MKEESLGFFSLFMEEFSSIFEYRLSLQLELLLNLFVPSHMPLSLADGGEVGAWVWRGGVGTVLGKSLEAAFRRAMDGSRDDITEVGSCRSERSGDGGDVVG